MIKNDIIQKEKKDRAVLIIVVNIFAR